MTKVENTKTHEIICTTRSGMSASEDVLVTDAELMLVNTNHRVDSEPNYIAKLLIGENCIDPILISQTEDYKFGELVYSIRGIIGKFGDFENCYRNECFKILALPEHFSPQQLQDIVDGKLKEGKCLVECWYLEEERKALPFGSSNYIKLNPYITVYPIEQKTYTERELEIAYCIGLLNRMLTMDELSKELKSAQEKINRLKQAFERGDFNPEK